MSRPVRRLFILSGVVTLLIAFALQLSLSSRRNSVTWDEGHHLFSGYMSLTAADFGLNPEVPPLAKLVAAAPLLSMDLHLPPLQGRFFKTECFLDGRDFLFHNDFNRVLFRARMAAALFSLALALLVFTAAREMFSTMAAFLAMALFVFDPNVLAHGALVTTDLGFALMLFATIYAWYRWRKVPSWSRLLLVALATGLALMTKFTGVLVFPMLVLLAACELMFPEKFSKPTSLRSHPLRTRALHLAGGLGLVAIASWIITWAFYGFRYAARPAGLALHPSLNDYLPQLAHTRSARILAELAHLRLMPESWIYGLADTKITADSYTSYFFGHVYPHGNWLYFPAAFLIKSTLPFLVLFVFALALLVSRRLRSPLEVLCLTVPPTLYFLVAMSSNMNIGARHLLPIYPFLYILGAGAFRTVIHIRRIRGKVWIVPFCALVLWQAIDSVSVYPAYMAFGNDLWGGPAQVHRYLSDANVDWGQQLNDVREYLRSRELPSASGSVSQDANSPCWFAYFPAGVVDPQAYGVPCRALPTADLLWWLDEPTHVPPVIEGTVLISDSDLEGIEFGEGPLNPYEQFRHLKPAAVIDDGVYVYRGRFSIPLAAGLDHAQLANDLLRDHHPAEALIEAQQAAALAPDLVNPQVALGDSLAALHRNDEARAAYQRALLLAQTVEPRLQTGWVHDLQSRVAQR
jgi:hypothetical protein